MKKLAIALGVVAFAAVSQASMISWSVNKNSIKTSGSSNLATGTYVYLIDNSFKSTIITALGSVDYTKTADQIATAISGIDGVVKAAKSTNTGGFASVTGIDIGADDGAYVPGTPVSWATLVLWKDGDTMKYQVSTALPKAPYTDDPESTFKTKQTVTFTSTEFSTDNWANVTGGGVPEPTSGLLLVLGLAGLALRRRRA